MEVKLNPDFVENMFHEDTIAGLFAEKRFQAFLFMSWKHPCTMHVTLKQIQVPYLLCFLQDFNLPLAVALGACSFEAYNLPYHMYGVKVVTPHSSSALPQPCTFPGNACIGIFPTGVAYKCCQEFVKRGSLAGSLIPLPMGDWVCARSCTLVERRHCTWIRHIWERLWRA